MKAKVLISLSLAVIFGASPILGAVLVEWPPQSGANYYEGSFETDVGQAIRFRTRETRVLLPSDDKLVIHSVESHHQIRDIPDHDVTRLGSGESASADDFDTWFDANDIGESHAPLLGKNDQNSNVEIDQKVKEERAPLPRRFLLVDIGIGNESLQAEGGLSEFSASSFIGGTNIYATWDERRSLDPSDRQWQVQVLWHNFKVRESEELSVQTSSERSEEKSYMRLDLAIFLQRPQGWSFESLGGVRLGVGLNLSTLPVVEIADKTTGASKLKSTMTVGPTLALDWVQDSWVNIDYGIVAQITPYAWGQSGQSHALGTRLFFRKFLENWVIETSASARAVRMQKETEDFRIIRKLGKFLDRWCTRAMKSKIDPMKKVARMLRSHRELLLNWFDAKGATSAGIVEGMNNKVKVTTQKSIRI